MHPRALTLDVCLSLTLALALAATPACSDRQFPEGSNPDGGGADTGGGADSGGGPDSGGGECGAPPPPSAPCFDVNCGSDISYGYVCAGGSWVCPPGTTDESLGCWGGECLDPEPTCAPGCGGDVLVGAECSGPTWRCPEGSIDISTCPPDTCFGKPAACCDGSSPRCEKGSFVCDAGFAGTDDCSCPPPTPVAPDEPSQQTVRFGFGAVSGWLVTQGNKCGAVQIERLTDQGADDLPQGVTQNVVCKGEPGPAAGPITLTDLSAGAAGLSWDARFLELHSVCVNCADRGFPGGGLQYSNAGLYRVAAAGRYRATFAIADDLAGFGCQEPTGGTVACFPQGDSGFDVPDHALCTASRTVSVEFELPASGDLQVAVP